MGNRGVVNTCSYEARAFGVRSAMPVGRARQLCPQAVFLASDYGYYGPASSAFHSILRDYTPLVEPAGADEGYLDVAGSELLFGDPPTIAADIRRRVREEIGITASAGVSSNKLVSKVASDAGKPDGLVVVPAGQEAAFLAARPIRELPMIGPKTAAALAALGIRTIGELAGVPVGALESRFGRHGRELHERALGIHEGPVLAGHGANRSVSRETTFGTDEPSGERLRAVLRSQAERVAADLARQDRAALSVTLKLRFPPFETLTRSHSTGQPVTLADEVFAVASAMFERAWSENDHRPVRLIGLGVTHLRERGRQLQLGETLEAEHLAEAVAEVRARFGEKMLRRAAELHAQRPDEH